MCHVEAGTDVFVDLTQSPGVTNRSVLRELDLAGNEDIMAKDATAVLDALQVIVLSIMMADIIFMISVQTDSSRHTDVLVSANRVTRVHCSRPPWNM